MPEKCYLQVGHGHPGTHVGTAVFKTLCDTCSLLANSDVTGKEPVKSSSGILHGTCSQDQCPRASTFQSDQGPTMASLRPGISCRFAFTLAYPRRFSHLRSGVTFNAKLNQKHCPQLAIVITIFSELDLVNLNDGQRITHAFLFSFHSHSHAEGVTTDCPQAWKEETSSKAKYLSSGFKVF